MAAKPAFSTIYDTKIVSATGDFMSLCWYTGVFLLFVKDCLIQKIVSKEFSSNERASFYIMFLMLQQCIRPGLQLSDETDRNSISQR
jgi:hypothetical protein